VLLDTAHANAHDFNLSVNIASELFDTLRINDSVNVVTFDSTAAALVQPNSVSVSRPVTPHCINS
jgi:hypothetical protein